VTIFAPYVRARSTNPCTPSRWDIVMSGPMSVAGSSVGPTFNSRARSATPDTKSAYSGSCTYARVAAVQSCPQLM